ncbi:hypothetical protein D9758_005507 [Tetrapyrgos nigripes]|uniref:Uncharacterized protein n=1 Tax=Tetrapyrgos nigripes TaxID=182062 RepID=A0A8H5LPE4_9AGAR|nr:hypothetical protein D9758_005507 [Tetrapyrgos nigripes]
MTVSGYEDEDRDNLNTILPADLKRVPCRKNILIFTPTRHHQGYKSTPSSSIGLKTCLRYDSYATLGGSDQETIRSRIFSLKPADLGTQNGCTSLQLELISFIFYSYFVIRAHDASPFGSGDLAITGTTVFKKNGRTSSALKRARYEDWDGEENGLRS